MVIARLGDRLQFPDPSQADDDGLVAFGGDLSAPRLIRAYRSGIFPWFEAPEPYWFSPDPRLVLDPSDIQISRSLRSLIRRGTFEIRVDSAFPDVIRGCAKTSRPRQDGSTWISERMQAAYTLLFKRAYAHSIECWAGSELVGGLYGLGLGRCFFGESMFSKQPNASKTALVALAAIALERGLAFIDCQVPTPHLISMGAKEVPRSEFLARLAEGLRVPTSIRPWSDSWAARSSTADWLDRMF